MADPYQLSVWLLPGTGDHKVRDRTLVIVLVGANSRGSSMAKSVGFLNRRLEVGILPTGQITVPDLIPCQGSPIQVSRCILNREVMIS